MESKLLLPAVALSLLSFSTLAAGISSDSTADVNKLTMPSFEDMDVNHDGMMSKGEFDAGMDKMHGSSMGNNSMDKDAMHSGRASLDSLTHSTPGKDNIAPGAAMGK